MKNIDSIVSIAYQLKAIESNQVQSKLNHPMLIQSILSQHSMQSLIQFLNAFRLFVTTTPTHKRVCIYKYTDKLWKSYSQY